MTTERDIRNQMAYAREQGMIEGMEKGREEERLATAKNLKTLGVPVTTIAEGTGLTAEQIERL